MVNRDNTIVRYNLDGKYYDIPADKVEDFERDKPKARQVYRVGQDTYEIPLEKREGFLGKYPSAEYFNGGYVNPDYQPQPVQQPEPIQQPAVQQSVQMPEPEEPAQPQAQAAPPSAPDSIDGHKIPQVHAPNMVRRAAERNAAKEAPDAERGEYFQQDESDAVARIDELYGAREKELKDAGQLRSHQNLADPYGIPTYDMPEDVDYDAAVLKQAKRMYVEAEKTRKAAEGGRGFGKGLVDSFTEANWDFGISDFQKNAALMTAAKKLDEGQELTEAENILLDAAAHKMASDMYYGDFLGRGYKAGLTTGQSLPFMLEFMMNPVSGSAEGGGSIIGKALAKKLGEKITKEGVAKAASVAGRVVGDIASAAAMTGTTGALSTTADAMQRRVGDIKFSETDDGIKFDGVDGGTDTFFGAFAQAYGARTIENFSEMFGEYFKPIGSAVGGWTSKRLERMGLQRVNDFIDNIGTAEWMETVNHFLNKTHWNGVAGEFGEELVGGVMNALTVGDQSLGEVFSKDNLIDTFLGVGAFGGFVSAIKTVGYRTPKQQMEDKRKRVFKKGSETFDDQEDWAEVTSMVDHCDEDELRDFLGKFNSSGYYTPEQEEAILAYAFAREERLGADKARAKKEADEPEQANLDDIYEVSVSLTDPEAKRAAKVEYDTALAEIARAGISDDEIHAIDEDSAYAGMIEAMQPELKPILDRYTQARAAIVGVNDSINEEMQADIDRAEQDIRSKTADGIYYDITLKDGTKVGMKAGRLAKTEDGSVDRRNSSDKLYVTMPDGKVRMISPREVQSFTSAPAGELFNTAKRQIEDAYQRQLAREIETPTKQEIADSLTGEEEPFNIGGATVMGTATHVTADGNVVVRFDDDVQLGDSIGRVHQIPIADFVSLRAGTVQPAQAIEPQPQEGQETPVEQPQAAGRQEVQPEVETRPQAAQQATEYDFRGRPMPMKEDGRVDQSKLFESDPESWAEWETKRRNDGGKSAQGYLKGEIARQQRQLDALQKKYDAEPDFDKRDELSDQIKTVQKRIESINKAAESVEARQRLRESREMEPQSVDELVSQYLNAYKGQLDKEDFLRETGYSDSDLQGFVGGFVKDGGLSVSRLAEIVKESDDTGLTAQLDDIDIRDSILNVLSQVKSWGDVKNFIKNNRAAMAEELARREQEAIEAAQIAQNAQEISETPAELSEKQQEIAAAEAEVDTEPTEAQKEAGNYKKGHIKLDGYDITIEQPKGSVRSGVDAQGREWSQVMNNTYGYIRGTEGVDGDHIDVFLSDNPEEGNVFVVDQVKPDGSFDEHKVMYGFPDMEAARAAYLSNYEEGWTGLGAIAEVSRDEFKKWVESSHRKTKPFSEYKTVKTEGDVRKEGVSEDAAQGEPSLRDKVRGIIEQSDGNPELADRITDEEMQRFSELYDAWQAESERADEVYRNNQKASVSPNKKVSAPAKKAIKDATEAAEKAGLPLVEYYQHLAGQYGLLEENPAEIEQKEAEIEQESQQIEQKPAENEQKPERLPRYGQLRKKIDSMSQALHTPIIVHESPNDVNDAAAYRALLDGDTITGWYDGKTGEVHIYAPNIGSLSEAERKVFHELVGHKGVRDLLGREGFDELCDRVWEIIPEKRRSELLGKVQHLAEEKRQRAAADEYIAELAETVDYKSAEGIWHKIAEFFRSIFEKRGYQPEMTDKDISVILRESYKRLAMQRMAEQEQAPAAEAETEAPATKATITPAKYTTKKGRSLDMFLVRPGRELSKDEKATASGIAKESRGWYSREDGGFMMRDKESAQRLADALESKQSVQDARPLSVEDLQTSGEVSVIEMQPETKEEEEPKWRYELTAHRSGHSRLERYQVLANGQEIYDGNYEVTADTPEDLKGILENNGLYELLSDSDKSELDRKIHLYNFDKQKADEGVNGYRLGEKVMYTPYSGKTALAKIHDFEDWGEHRPVLDTGLAPVIYEVVEWSSIDKFEGPSAAAREAAAAAVEQPKEERPVNPSGNKLVTDEQYADLVRRMKEKLKGQMNMGIDPEIFSIGAQMAVYHIEKGARKFVAYAKAMIADLGDAIKPYLKAFYNGARDLPGMEKYEGEMDSYDDVRGIDVNTLGEAAPDIAEAAQAAVEEAQVEKEADKAKERIKRVRKDVEKAVPSQESSAPLGGLFAEIEENNSNTQDDGIHDNRPEQDNPGGSGETGEAAGQERGGTDRGGEGKGVEDGRTLPARPRYSVRKNLNNNRGERGVSYAPTTPIERFKANIAAIKKMRELVDSGKKASKADMEVLRQFSGWGGLGSYFNEAPYSSVQRMLHDAMTDEEIASAELSINSSYYTPVEIIDSLWDAAKNLGFTGGRILEGSAGVGNILANMPKAVSEASDITAVEIDSVTGNILKLLYPDADVQIRGFEDVKIPNNSVDLAITNVPFVTGLHVVDEVEKDLSRKFGNIHDFCIAKNVRKLREGGIGIFITSNGTLDKSRALRQWVTTEGGADFVGAFRLNNQTFGGTPVTSDIIIVRKRVGGKAMPGAADMIGTTVTRRDVYKEEGKFNRRTGQYEQTETPVSIEYNTYFVEHPENMAGEMLFNFDRGETFRPTSVGLFPVDGKDQKKMLGRWVKKLSDLRESMEAAPQVAEETAAAAEPEAVADKVKEGQLVVNSKGEVCINSLGKAVPLGVNNNKVKGQTKEQVLKDYNALKSAIDAVLEYQTNNESDEGLAPLLEALNGAYDGFVGKYGPLNKNTSLSFLRNDVDFPSVAAVEDYTESLDQHGKRIVTTKKTDVFTKRMVGFKATPKPKDAKDGVIVSMNQFGRIDLPYIAKAVGRGEDVVRGEILDSGLAFEDPMSGSLEVSYEYLSGNVREKLAYARSHNEDGRYDNNIKALEKVIPLDIPAHLIEFSLGSDWLEPGIYSDFAKEKYGLSDDFEFKPIGGTWQFIRRGWKLNEYNDSNRSAGVKGKIVDKQVLGHELMLHAMNNTRPEFKESHKDRFTGETTTTVDKEAEQAAQTRIDEIKDEFREWAKGKMSKDEDLAKRVTRTYNDLFNAIVPKEIDERFIPERFEGANMEIKLYPHQAKAVIRATTEPLMMAHEVGSGKTFTLITSAMEMRRLGTAKKPMVVVQNSTVGQFLGEAKKLYPRAKILTVSEGDRTQEGRAAFYAKIKYNDWDMIVVPQSVFNMIPDSEERKRAFIQARIDEKMYVLQQAKDAGADSQAIKRMEKELKDLEGDLEEGNIAGGGKKRRNAKTDAKVKANAAAKAKRQLDRKVDAVEDFDQMEIDALLIDEAHEYKHLGFATALQQGIKGVDPSVSQKAASVFLKTRSVFDRAGWKNVVFATGTPISNTAAEIWTFMRYLMPDDVMLANHIYYFDDFVRNFGNIAKSLEFATNGKFRENTRFSAYVNLPELVRIWASVADTVLAKDAEAAKGKKLSEKIPNMEGGKAQDIYLEQSPSLVAIMRKVREILDKFEKMTGKEKRRNSHIPLTAYGIAKRAAIDPRLVMQNAPDEPNSKTNKAVDIVVEDLEATKDYNGTVVIFCDRFRRRDADGSEGFNVFDDIKKKLVARGVPADKIAIIRSEMRADQKERVFAKVNSGDIRVVMGSTQLLGTGVNIQERLHMAVHMDAPDRPMDYTQRNGRILRQGNVHKDWDKTVRVVRFGVEDSLDVTAYQRLKTKAAFIDSVMDSKPLIKNGMENRTLEEEEEGLFDNPVAVLSGSQFALLKSQAERELRKLRNKQEMHKADQIYIANQLQENERKIISFEGHIERFKKSAEAAERLFPGGKVKKVVIEGVSATTDEEIGKVIAEKVSKPLREKIDRWRDSYQFENGREAYVFSFDGVKVDVVANVTKKSDFKGGMFVSTMSTTISFSCPELGVDVPSVPGGINGLRDIVPMFKEEYATGKHAKERIEDLQNRIDRMKDDNGKMQARKGKPFADQDKLVEAQKRVAEYTEAMIKELAEKEAKYSGVETGEADIELEDAEEDDVEVEEGGDTHFSRGDIERARAAASVTGQTEDEALEELYDRRAVDFLTEDTHFSRRTKPEPVKKGIGYKVFFQKDGKLYPPMVANPGGEDTPVGVWLDADAAPIVGESKTGRPQVKQGGKGTQGGSGTLAYRPGWHLGEIPYAKQFNRLNPATGERDLFPKDFVWAEVEYAADNDYQQEADAEGMTEGGRFRHSYAGLKRVPEDGFYRYRTNPNPETDPWIITGSMRVKKVLTNDEVDDLVRAAGREPQQREGDTRFSRAYHGSPARFDKFDHAHIGEGEGHQSHGYGTYITFEEGTARRYSLLGDRDKVIYKGKRGPTYYANEIVEFIKQEMRDHDVPFEEAKARMLNMLKKAEERRKEMKDTYWMNQHNDKEIEFIEGLTKDDFEVRDIDHNFYEVEIPDDTGDNYLDEDRNVTKPMRTKIVEALRGLPEGAWKTTEDDKLLFHDLTLDDFIAKMEKGPIGGDRAYAELARGFRSKKAASEFLHDAGFVGLKYVGGLDGECVVIFDDRDISIESHTMFSRGFPQKEGEDDKGYLRRVAMDLTDRYQHLAKYVDISDDGDTTGRAGAYNFVHDIIRIFAHPNTSYDEYEGTFFHENLHAYLYKNKIWKDSEALDGFIEFIRSKSPDNIAEMEREITKDYEEKERKEELFVQLTESMMSEGFSRFVLPDLPDRTRELITNYYNAIGYDTEREEGERAAAGYRGNHRGLEKVPVPQEEVRVLRGDAEDAGSTGEGEGVTVFSRKAPLPDDLKGRYEARVTDVANKVRESHQDSMLALKVLQEELVRASGRPLESFEDAYAAENQLSSVNSAEKEFYTRNYFDPMIKAVRDMMVAAGIDYEGAIKYAIAKHGLERNEVFHDRDEQAAGETIERRDYSGLTSLMLLDGEDAIDLDEAEERARIYVDDIEGRAGAECASMWQKVKDATKKALYKSWQSGILTRSEYENVRDMFNFYVPLRGFDEETAEQHYEYLDHKSSPFSPAMRTAKGRTSIADDPFATIGNMWESTVQQGNNNLVKQKFLNMVLNRPNDLVTVKPMWYTYDPVADEWTQAVPQITNGMSREDIQEAFDSFQQRMEALEQQGLASKKKPNRGRVNIPYRLLNKQDQEHMVVVKSGGKEWVLVINGNPRAAQAINGLTNPDRQDFLAKMAKANRWMAANFTTRSPKFMVRNAFRDTIFSLFSVDVKEDSDYNRAFRGNLMRNYGRIWNLMKRFKAGEFYGVDENDLTETERLFREFMMNGGETGYTQLKRVDEYKKMISRIVGTEKGTVSILGKEIGGVTGKGLRKLSNVLDALGNMVGFANRCIEDICRLSAYMTSRQMGRDIQTSVANAKDISVNFNKKGSGSGYGSGVLGATHLFYNAGVQGLENFANLREKSRRTKFGNLRKFDVRVAETLALGAIIPLLNNIISSAVGGDDDEYADLPDWVRRNNLVLGGGGFYLTIPLPIELRALYGIGDIAYMATTGRMKNYTPYQLGWEVVGQVADIMPLNPVEGVVTDKGSNIWENIGLALLPDQLAPMTESLINKDFTGKPIYKDNSFNKNDPAYTKAYAGASKFLVGSAELLNDITGGDEYAPGAININPAKVEHLYEGYLGGLATFINETAKSFRMIRDEDARQLRNFPIVNVLFQKNDERTASSYVNDMYWHYKQEADVTEKRARGYRSDGDFEKAARIASSSAFKRYQYFKEADKRVKKLQDELKDTDDKDRQNFLRELIVDEKTKIVEYITEELD